MVRFRSPELVHEGDDVVVTAQMSGIRPAGTVRYRFPARYAPTEESMADALFPIGLLLAMATDRELVLDAPASSRLVAQSETVQDIFTSWYPEKFGRARLEVVPRTDADVRPAEGTMSTFTGGVDSFYTLHRNADTISSLLFVHGFDIPLAHTEFRRTTSEHLKASADSAQKDLIEGATNLRRFLNPHVTWSSMSHGAAIASFSLLLASSHGTLLVPASYSYADVYPWGSHPLLDPLWSTEYLTIKHEGAGATRVAKTRSIAHDAVAQHHLRVCFQKTGDYNCGTCKKCLRTMMALDVEGTLGDFSTFTSRVDLDAVRRLGVRSESDLIFARENLAFAHAKGRQDVADVLTASIDEYRTARSQQSSPGLVAEVAALRAQLEAAEQQVRRLEASSQAPRPGVLRRTMRAVRPDVRRSRNRQH